MNDNKKIIYVSSDSNRSGGPVHILKLATNLKKKGYQIKVITSKGWLSKQLSRNNIETVYIKISITNIFKFRKLFREHKEWIIHFQGVKAGGIPRLASIGLPNKKVYTEHLWTEDYNLDSFIRQYIQLFALGFLSGFTDKIICVSNAVKDFYTKSKLAKPEKLEIIYNGVEFFETKDNNSSNNLVLGVIGSLEKIKGFDQAIKAVNELKGVNLLIVGNGSQKEYLKELTKELGLIDRVTFKDEMDSKDFFDKIDIYLQTSYSESFGLALVEALGSGKPVIASDTQATKEIIGSSTYLYKKGKYEELKEKLSLLIRGIEKEKKYFKSKSSEFRTRYSIDHMIENHDELYSNL